MEVTHINNVLRPNPLVQPTPTNGQTSQLRNMARQVQLMFPRYPLSTIIADLQLSRSMEVTIDNILEGRLLVPNQRFDFDDNETSSDTTPSSIERLDFSRRSSDSELNSNTINISSSNSNNSANSSLVNLNDAGYEIEQSTNIFGNQNDLLRDER